MRNAQIIATGAAVPEKIVPNQYFNDYFGEDIDTWLSQNVQIYERRWCSADETTADLCERAARQALERANLKPEDLDLLIVATDTPQYMSPSTAVVVQHRLNAKNAGTFDLNTACAGFVTALDVASKYIIADEQYQHVMVIGAYTMSKYLNPNDKKTVTLFADGAGAAILKSVQKVDNQGFLASKLISRGEFHDFMGIYAGGSFMPMTCEVMERGDHLLKFVKKFPKELNPVMWTMMTNDLCERIGITPQDINLFLMTQININSIFETMDALHLPPNKAHTIMHYYGYTGSAAIPIALDDAWQKGKIKKGDYVFFIGSGGGLAFAAAAFKM